MLKIKELSVDGYLMPGSIEVEKMLSPQAVTVGGIILPDQDKDKYDTLQFGRVVNCAELYADHRGQLFKAAKDASQSGEIGIWPWPIPAGWLVLYKKQQAWQNPADRDRIEFISTSGLVKVWNPEQYEAEEQKR